MKTKLKPILALLVLGVHTHAATSDPVPGLEAQPASYFYTGKPYDSDAESYSFAFRNYAPAQNRWTSADPSGFPDGPNSHGYVSDPVSQVDPNGLVTISFQKSSMSVDSLLSIGQIGHFTPSFNLTIGTAATHRIEQVGDCYRAVATSGAQFGALSVMTILPLLGSVSSAPAGTVDATTIGQVGTHEGWHEIIYATYIHQVFTAYETWTSNYVGNLFHSAGTASSAFATDLANGLTLAGGSGWRSMHDAATLSHPADGYVNSGGFWRDRNPDWGLSAATNLAGQLDPRFRIQDGERCE